ncbi:unnamed protein product [Sphenostylis stenocarpa]|uniref:Retrotransposon gag domain-containing protein n=1 Tax=Sphenostylis stenocarpa TaxID=92480 RepID=A0AA86S1J7_9FABA|nr:unnamed protein product [Sphenostylis stenocarpa]
MYEYAIQFERLYRFYSQATSEEWKCQRFSDGLKADIKVILIPLEITMFAKLVDHTTIIEGLMQGGAGGVGKAQSNRSNESQGKSGGARKGPYHSQGRRQRFRSTHSGGATSSVPRPVGITSSPLMPRGVGGPSWVTPTPSVVRCYWCSGPHFMSQCPQPGQSGAASSTASALHAMRPRAVRIP